MATTKVNVSKISDFPKVTPAGTDQILVEKDGQGGSITLSQIPVSTPVEKKISDVQKDLNDRITALAFEPGDTTGDAELRDIRNPAEGFTVPANANAAVAVRAQVTQLDDKISDLKGDLNEIITEVISKNLLPIATKNTILLGINSTYSDGVISISGIATGNGGRLTPLTDAFTLPPGTYTFSRDVANESIFVEAGSTILAALQGDTRETTFMINSVTECYIGINVISGYVYDIEYKIQIEKGETATDFQTPSYTYITAIDKKAQSDIEEIGLPYQKIAPKWLTGKAFIYNAGWTNNSGWSYADVDLIQGQSLDITIYCEPNVYPLSVWSADGESIIRACFPLASEFGEKHFIYACSAQHEKVRINVLTSQKSTVTAKIYKPNNQVNISNIVAINHGGECFDVLHENIIAIGDSLTQGSYTGNDLHVNQSYPAFMAKKMGNTVVNAGRAGWNTKEWWDGDSSSQKGFPYYTYTDYDTAVICLGTNGGLTDTLDTDVTPYESYTDYANTNTGCYCKIIEGMKAQNASINILLCNIWAGGGTGGIDVTNAVIDKIAKKYGLPVIDLLTEFRTPFSIYHAVSGNIHLGRIGYARMADIIRQAINDNVLNSPTNYNYIPS